MKDYMKPEMEEVTLVTIENIANDTADGDLGGDPSFFRN